MVITKESLFQQQDSLAQRSVKHLPLLVALQRERSDRRSEYEVPTSIQP